MNIVYLVCCVLFCVVFFILYLKYSIVDACDIENSLAGSLFYSVCCILVLYIFLGIVWAFSKSSVLIISTGVALVICILLICCVEGIKGIRKNRNAVNYDYYDKLQ